MNYRLTVSLPMVIPKIWIYLLFPLFLATECFGQIPATRYAVALSPTPVLNTPDFGTVFGGRDGKTLSLDGCGQLRAMEFVALPGTVFRIEETIGRTTGATILRVTTDDYPYPAANGYFIDSRFVRTTGTQPSPRPRRLPPRQQVLDNLLAALGSRYVWGGNCRAGVPQLLSLYPPAPGFPLAGATADLWQLRGVDCSGLLYEATGGFTPRNTSALVDYGTPVPIAGLSPARIVWLVEPLDLIAWRGHVMIVLDRDRLIESRLDCSGTAGGVRLRPLREALDEICRKRTPVNAYPRDVRDDGRAFVIRRWYR
jgi:cell wall-associated NlpC family hydrolase